MFWLAYLVAFLHSFWIHKGIEQGIPKQNIILSVLGMDEYLSELVPSFARVGEWFLGFIIIFYLVFPIIRKMMIKYPIGTATITLIIYITLNINYPFKINRSIFLFTRLPELLFGMYFIRYRRKISWKSALLGLTVILINSFIQIPFNKDIQTTYVGISAFIVGVFVASFLEKHNIIRKICSILSKYSYAIFFITSLYYCTNYIKV